MQRLLELDEAGRQASLRAIAGRATGDVKEAGRSPRRRRDSGSASTAVDSEHPAASESDISSRSGWEVPPLTADLAAVQTRFGSGATLSQLVSQASLTA